MTKPNKTKKNWLLRISLTLIVLTAILMGGYYLVRQHFAQELKKKYLYAMVLASNAMLNMKEIEEADVPMGRYIPLSVVTLQQAVEQHPPANPAGYRPDEPAIASICEGVSGLSGVMEEGFDVPQFLHRLHDYLAAGAINREKAADQQIGQDLIAKNDRFFALFDQAVAAADSPSGDGPPGKSIA